MKRLAKEIQAKSMHVDSKIAKQLVELVEAQLELVTGGLVDYNRYVKTAIFE